MSFQQGSFVTRIGRLEVSITQNDHAYVHTPDNEPAKVNNVEWRFSAHVHKRSDGQWYIGTDPEPKDLEGHLYTDEQGRTWKQKESLYIRKKDLYEKNREPSDSVFNKVWSAVTEGFRVWAASNERLFLLAEAEYRKDRLTWAKEEVAKAEAELSKRQSAAQAADVAYSNALANAGGPKARAMIFGLPDGEAEQ